MFRAIFRYLTAGALAGVIALLLLTSVPPRHLPQTEPSRPDKTAFAACRRAPSAQCLTDLGVAQAMHRRSLPGYLREVDILAQMGRFEEARALAMRVESGKQRAQEIPPETIEASVNRRLAPHLLAAALRGGGNLQAAMADTPGVDTGVLYIGALDLLGRHPYDTNTAPEERPADRTRAVVSEIAATIATLAQQQPEKPRANALIHAAELHAALGQRDRAMAVLAALPQNMENPLLIMSKDLIRIIGAPEALRMYRDAGGQRTSFLLAIAEAETDGTRATKDLEQAFSEFQAQKIFPDFRGMENTVERAAALGLDALSLRLARALAEQAQTAPFALPVFPHLTAARALLSAKAPEAEVRASLARAEAAIPGNPNKVVAVGAIGGAYRWGKSGLASEARRDIATMQARLGDVSKAVHIMEGIDQPVFAWNDMLSADIPLDALNDLLAASENILPDDGQAYLRAQLAQRLLGRSDTELMRTWARATAHDLLEAKRFDGARGGHLRHAGAPRRPVGRSGHRTAGLEPSCRSRTRVTGPWRSDKGGLLLASDNRQDAAGLIREGCAHDLPRAGHTTGQLQVAPRI